MATIWYADILIWAATRITEALDRDEQPSRVIHFHPHNLLKSIRRPTGGEHCLRLRYVSLACLRPVSPETAASEKR